MHKYETVRIVTFKEDYYTSERGPEGKPQKKLLFKQGHKQPMHKDLAERLEQRGAKVKIEPFDPRPIEAKAKQRLIERREKEAKMVYVE
jgi:hypothetical protein